MQFYPIFILEWLKGAIAFLYVTICCLIFFYIKYNINLRKVKIMKKFILILVLITLFAYSEAIVKVKKESYSTNEGISVYIENMSTDKKNWIGIYPVESNNDWGNVVSWRWTDKAEATTITVPQVSKAGKYEARVFFNNTFVVQGKSQPFDVRQAIADSAELNSSEYHITTCADKISINFKKMGNHSNDWIGLYPTGSSNEWKNIIAWRWMKNKTEGTVELSSPNNEGFPIGTYELRAFFNNSFIEEGISRPIFITPCENPVELNTTKKVYTHREAIEVSYSNMSTDPKNWIAIYKKGSKSLGINCKTWTYTGQKTSGFFHFNKKATWDIGEYDVRAFFNDTRTIQQLTSFKIERDDFFPQTLLDKGSHPAEGVYIKNRYIFVKANSPLYKKYKGISFVTRDNGDPIIQSYRNQTWREKSIYLSEHNILVLVDEQTPAHIKTFDFFALRELDDVSTHGHHNFLSLSKVYGLDLFYTQHSTAEHPLNHYYYIDNKGKITAIEGIDDGARDSFFIQRRGKLGVNRYYITYRKTKFIDGVLTFEDHKRIYDITDLPAMPLVDTIITTTQP